MRCLLQWIRGSRERTNLALALAVVGIVGAWRLAAWSALHQQRMLADDLASVGAFVGAATANPAGNQVLFAHNTEEGLGIYTADIKTGRQQAVHEVSETKVMSGSLRVLGWSPDGSLFAYTRFAQGGKPYLALHSGYVGVQVDRVPLESRVDGFAWLTPKSFAYSNSRREVRLLTQGRAGKWKETVVCARSNAPPLTDFQAASPTSLVWAEGVSMYRCSLPSGEPERLWEGQDGGKLAFSFCRERNTCLIGEASKDGYAVSTLHLGQPWLTNRVCLIRDRAISGLKWANGGRNFLLVCNDPAGRTLLLGSEQSKETTSLFASGNVSAVTAQGGRLFIVGSTNVEPPGIWEYDCSNGALRCVINGSEQGEALYRDFQHEAGIVSIGTRQVTYHLWTPKPTLFRRKFPMVIGQTPYAWSPYPYMAVNSRHCFVTVDRPGWYEGLENWGEDVRAVLEKLRSHPRVDTAEAYLYGRSAETSPLSEIVQEDPTRWRGILLFSPGALPPTEKSGWRKILVDIGEHDKGARERLEKYQAEAARNGVPLRLLLHETARHTSWSRATQRARLEDLGKWLERQ